MHRFQPLRRLPRQPRFRTEPADASARHPVALAGPGQRQPRRRRRQVVRSPRPRGAKQTTLFNELLTVFKKPDSARTNRYPAQDRDRRHPLTDIIAAPSTTTRSKKTSQPSSSTPRWIRPPEPGPVAEPSYKERPRQTHAARLDRQQRWASPRPAASTATASSSWRTRSKHSSSPWTCSTASSPPAARW